MPLPAALLARLAKRGILEDKTEPKTTAAKSEEVEEVFAEDYDDPSKPDIVPQVQPQPVILLPQLPVVAHLSQDVIDIVGEGPVFFKTTACPNSNLEYLCFGGQTFNSTMPALSYHYRPSNVLALQIKPKAVVAMRNIRRSNPYHECLAYCKKRYGMREWDPDDDMIKRRDRMLRKYPLPEGWVEVGDFDTGRYYYWNIHTDEVSWLSPSHPRAQVSRSAELLGIVGKIGNLDSDGEEKMDISVPVFNSDESGSDTSLSDEEEEEYVDRKPKRSRGRPGYVKKDDLDPMDPAAYSDIPRGGWSEGLDQRGKAKTGVDTTASGPLFQQRPYPSPGEILRANQSLKKKK